jgi:LacI family transcriptional regulator
MHLIHNGLRHFGYFADEDRSYDLNLRQQGFSEAVAKVAGTIQEYVDTRPWCRTPWPQLQDRLGQWLEALPKPVGIGVSSDARAAFLLDVCRKRGLRIPEEVSVVGVGNDPITCECTRPTLSSVELGAARVGYAAAELLQQIIGGAAPPGQPILVPPLDIVARQSSDYRSIGDPLVADCLTFIRERIPKGVCLPDVLEMSRVSQRTLEMRFRKALGRTPAAEIRRLQVQRAKQLLADTNLPMSQVAGSCGFSNQVRFGIVFRRLEGQTPGEYRRRMG